jgi:hypothetical protein
MSFMIARPRKAKVHPSLCLRGRLRKRVGEKPHFRDPRQIVRSLTAPTPTGMYAPEAAVGRQGIIELVIRKATALLALGFF